MKRRIISNVFIVCAILCLSAPLYAHHGVASIGAIGLEGPGAPLETSTSQTIPEKSFLLYYKMDYADFRKFTDERDDEGDYSAFMMYGIGYGITPYLSLYVFAPFNVKVVENNSYNTAGFADPSVFATFSFKYDDGLKLTPPNESLDDMMDWHFAIYGGSTIPSGFTNIADAEGNIDPGKSLGFGKPSLSFGFATTKEFAERFTYVLDVNYVKFFENEYRDGTRLEFGPEFRVNTALNYRLLTMLEKKFRLDANIEGTYLNLGRDIENGEGAKATGGHIFYILPGFRAYVNNVSIGLGAKFPVYTILNEADEQQGAEGKEKIRIIFSFSAML
ncbi:MAG: transporter [Deltaproteobacteria bacterium]|nr:transporter [Deltaproteobacteria bacterium]